MFGILALFGDAGIARPDSPAGGDSAPFITAVVEQEFPVGGKAVKRWVPTSNRLAFAWSDQPFAVHFPFQLETKVEFGRVQSKPYRVSAWMNGFGTTTNSGGRSAPGVLVGGLYRFDGGPCLPGDTNRFFFPSEFRDLRSMSVLPAGEGPVTNTWMPAVFLRSDLLGPARYAVWLIVDPRPRLVSGQFEPDLRETERLSEVRGIPPGVWSTNETLKGAMNVVLEELAVDPSKDRPSPGEFGRPASATPARQATPGWKRTNSHEVSLKQNGWQLRSMAVTKNGDLSALRYTLNGGDPFEYADLGETFVPSTFTSTHRVTSRSSDASLPPRATDVRITVTFPARLLDHGLQWASLDMQQVGKPGGTPYDARYGLDPGEGVLLFAHPFLPKGTLQAIYPDVLEGGRDRFTDFLWNTADAIGRSRNPATGLSGERWWVKFPNGARGANPFNPTGGGTLPGLWTADGKLDQPHPLLSLDLKFWGTLKSTGTNVIKHVDFLALRLSDLEDNRAGFIVRDSPSVVARLPDDGYHDWLVRFHQQREKTEERLHEIAVELSARDGMQRQLHAKWFKLLWLDMKSWPVDPAESDGLIESIGRSIGRAATGGSGIPLQPTIAKSMLEALKQERDGIQPQVDALRREQAALIAEGTRMSKMLVETADLQTVGSRGNDQHLAEVKRTLEHIRDRHDLNRLHLYDVAGWHGTPEMQQLLDELKFNSTAARELVKIMEAKGWLVRAKSLDRRLAVAVISPNPVKPNSPVELEAHAARMEAMRALNEALKENSESIQARAMLEETELEMLGWIQRKLDHERHLSMAGFQQYLGNRGYNPGQAKGWWDGFKELNCAFWGSSPVTLGGGLGRTNTAGLVADDTILVQDAIAKNQVSLFAIQRLIRRHLSLKTIRNITADKLAEQLAFQSFERKPLDKAKAQRLCLDIHETFGELTDLRALAEGDIDEFQKFIQRNYYASFDGSKTWSESIGDFFFSPLSIALMAGPGAVVKAGGKWVVTVPRAEMALLEESGRLLTVRDVFASTFKLEYFGRRITSTRLGGMLADAVIEDQRFLANRSLLERFLNGGARLAASVTIYCGAEDLAEQSGVPGLSMLVTALGALGAEEIAHDILSRNGTPLRKLITKCDQFAAILSREEKELAQLTQARSELEKIEQRLSARTQPGSPPKLTGEEIKQIDQAIAQLPSPRKETLKVAGIDKKEDARNTLTSAAEALKKGETEEAKRALGAGKVLQDEMNQTLDAYGLALVKARENLAKNPVLRQITATEQLKPIGEMKGNPPLFAPEGGYPNTPAGIALKFGDEAVQKGKLDEALDFYRHALHHAEEASADEVARLIQSRLALLADATAEAETFNILRRGPSRAPPCTKAIEEQHVTEMLADIAADKLEVVPNPRKSANAVYKIQEKAGGNTSFLFKVLDDADAIACEVFGPAAAHELGFTSAQARRVKMKVPRINNKGELVLVNGVRVFEEAEGFLVRAAEGVELLKFTEATLLALKEDYAKLRVFRLWLGDSDGHLGNFLLTAEGQLLPIDFDWASLKKDGFIGQFRRPNANQKEFLKDVLDVPNFIRKQAAGHSSAPLYTWLGRIDGMLSYDEMGKTVAAIKELCGKDGGGKLKDILRQALPKEKVQEAFEALTERAGLLEEVLKERFPVFKKTAALHREFDLFHDAPAIVWRTDDSEILALAA